MKSNVCGPVPRLNRFPSGHVCEPLSPNMSQLAKMLAGTLMSELLVTGILSSTTGSIFMKIVSPFARGIPGFSNVFRTSPPDPCTNVNESPAL